MPGRRVRRCRSSPLQGEATPFSPSAGCGLLSQSIHVLPRMDHYRKLQRPHLARCGGLYALRARRCGCDSLSLAGSRQRVKSLRSSVRLRLGLSLLAGSSPELTPASPSSNLPRARRKARLFLPLSLQSQTRQRKLLVSGHAIPSFARASVLRLRDFRRVIGA